MRKAAFVVGIVCAALAIFAAVAKFMHLPGGSFLLQIATGLFCVIALPLWLVPQFREHKNKMRRIAILFTWIGVTNLLISLIYLVQYWRGVSVPIANGILFSTLALILFFVSSRQQGIVTIWFSRFTVVSMIIFATLLVTWGMREPMSARMTEAVMDYRLHEARKGELHHSCDSVLNTFKSEPWSGFYQEAAAYYGMGIELIAEIEKMKCEMVALSNGVDSLDSISVEAIDHPDDYGTPLSYMIGPDANRPTGKGIDLFHSIVEFSKLSGQGVPVSFGITDVQNDAGVWVRVYFFNLPLIQVLTQLTNFQQSILYTVQSDLDMKRFGPLKK